MGASLPSRVSRRRNVPSGNSVTVRPGPAKVRGGSPYGATTLADGDGSRQPSEEELDGARYQGRRIAETAIKLHG